MTSTGEYNLFIANVQLADDAEYQCQIGATDDFAGVMSDTATLTVLGKYRRRPRKYRRTSSHASAKACDDLLMPN